MGGDSRALEAAAAVATTEADPRPGVLGTTVRGGRTLAAALATGGAGLFFVVSWLPWWTITERLPPMSQGPLAPVEPGPIAPISLPFGWPLFALGPRLPEPWLPAAASGLIGFAALGLLLCPFLWQRSRPRVAALAAVAYGGWVLLATLVVALDFVGLLVRMRSPVLLDGSLVLRWGTAPGLWLGALALGGAWVGAGLLVVAGRAGDTARVARAATLPGSRLQVAGAGLLTLAVLLWACGFILLPWAEANTCTGSHLTLVHFVRAGCAAMDSGDAVGTALTGLLVHPGPATENFYYQIPLALFYAVVAAGALPLLAGVWGWSASRVVRVFSAVWLVVVSALGLVALRGVGSVVADPPFTGYGAWRTGPGVALTVAALLVAWLGAGLLWRATRRARDHGGDQGRAGAFGGHAFRVSVPWRRAASATRDHGRDHRRAW